MGLLGGQRHRATAGRALALAVAAICFPAVVFIVLLILP
jgi:hypothetical protein